jgi:hypothetical protein
MRPAPGGWKIFFPKILDCFRAGIQLKIAVGLHQAEACTKRGLAPSGGLHQAGACTKRKLAPSKNIKGRVKPAFYNY